MEVNNGLQLVWGSYYIEGSPASAGSFITFSNSFRSTNFIFVATHASNSTAWTGHVVTSNPTTRVTSGIGVAGYDAPVLYIHYMTIGH